MSCGRLWPVGAAILAVYLLPYTYVRLQKRLQYGWVCGGEVMAPHGWRPDCGKWRKRDAGRKSCRVRTITGQTLGTNNVKRVDHLFSTKDPGAQKTTCM